MKQELPQIGELLGGAYELKRVVGQGGWAVVFEALQLRMRRRVAVKVLAPRHANDALLLRRFEQEAMLSTHLKHPNIVELYDFGKTQGGLPYIAMELLEGGTVRDLIRANPDGIPATRAVNIGRQILAGLGEAHARGVLHRDIKPQNIFLCSFGGASDFVKVLDFGIAKVFTPLEAGMPAIDTERMGGGLVGSPRYMAPEAFLNKPQDASSDLFSVGLVVAELLGGRPVIEGDTELEVVTRLCSPQEFRFVAAVEQSPLFPVIAHALRKAPAQRFQSCEAMSAALQSAHTTGSWDSIPGLAPDEGSPYGETVKLDSAAAVAALDKQRPGAGAAGAEEESATEAFDTAAAIREHERLEAERAGRAATRGGPGRAVEHLGTSMPGRTRNMGRDGRRQAQQEAIERLPDDRLPTQMVVNVNIPPAPPKAKGPSGLMIALFVGIGIAALLCAVVAVVVGYLMIGR